MRRNCSQGFAGGPATSAQLNLPSGVTVDGGGNLCIADVDNNRIRKVSPAGIITTVAGNGTLGYSGDGGPATSAERADPAAVAADAAGNLYIVDSNNYRVCKVSPAGIITTIAGNGTSDYSGDGGPATNAQFSYPVRVAVDSAGAYPRHGHRRRRHPPAYAPLASSPSPSPPAGGLASTIRA
ncbi:MAG TPA: hypothetical protein VIY49_34965 [Bryobacteraceae bacterium]